MEHFQSPYNQDNEGRFIVPLQKGRYRASLGTKASSCTTIALAETLEFEEFAKTMKEYFQQNHTKPAPPVHANKLCNKVFYLPMRAVSKESSTVM